MATPESTYDLTTNVGKVRLYIQDTNVADAHFIDAEVNAFITEAGSSKLRAAAGLALITWAATLGREDESVSTGAWTGNRGDVAAKMQKLASTYFELDHYMQETRAPYIGFAAVDWTPSVEAERIASEDQ